MWAEKCTLSSARRQGKLMPIQCPRASCTGFSAGSKTKRLNFLSICRYIDLSVYSQIGTPQTDDSFHTDSQWKIQVNPLLDRVSSATSTPSPRRNPLIASVEQYPLGYPRLAALQSSDPAFLMFRRFTMLHSRVLLLSQEDLCRLESKLAEIDDAERTQLYLSSTVHDENGARRQIMQEIREKLRSYGLWRQPVNY